MAEKPAVTAEAAPLPRWALPVALVLFLLALLLVDLRLAPPDPLPVGAANDRFSAGRAHALLAEMLGDGASHPVGSAAQAETRERVIGILRRIGLAPRVEEGFACSPSGNCAKVANIVAEIPGTAPANAVVLAAHYDSVGAGAGASDDMTGVAAVLEVARILKAAPPARNSVIFLLDEGEEDGLLGAHAFIDGSPEMARVKAVVNLEARGTSGPSLLFETGRANLGTAPLVAASLARPVASSVFQTIYEYLPNDTDFSLFKRRDLAGLNFAFIDEPAQYHTQLDNLANASPGSLQHHGDNALASVRALAAADLAHPVPGQAVFFDLLGARLFWWPAAWGPILGALALLLVLVTIVLLFKRRLLTGGAFALGIVGWLGAVVLTLAVGQGLTFVLRFAGALRTLWPARGLPPQGTFWLLALAIVGFLALRRAGFFGLWAAAWLCWAGAGLALALVAPGVSYLFLVPALVAAVTGPALLGGGGGRTVAALLPGLVAALLWFPILMLMYQGLGIPMLWLVGTLAAVAFSSALPLLGGGGGGWRWGVSSAAALLAVVMLIGIVASPPFSAAAPQRMTFMFHQDVDSGHARWIVRTPPPLAPALKQAASFGTPSSLFPWTDPARGFLADATAVPLPAPELTVVGEMPAGGARVLHLHLRSPRGASTVGLVLPVSGIDSLLVAGREMPAPPKGEAWRVVEVSVPAAEGVEIEVTTTLPKPLEATVYDRTPGLPPAGAALLKARPDTAAAIQDGDVTMVTKKVAF